MRKVRLVCTATEEQCALKYTTHVADTSHHMNSRPNCTLIAAESVSLFFARAKHLESRTVLTRLHVLLMFL